MTSSQTSTSIPQTDTAATPAAPPTAWSLVATHDLLETPECSLALDEYRRGEDQLVLARARVDEWAPRVLDAISDTWSAFRACTGAPVFTCVDDDDQRTAFLTSLGFSRLQAAECTDGVTRSMWISVPA